MCPALVITLDTSHSQSRVHGTGQTDGRGSGEERTPADRCGSQRRILGCSLGARCSAVVEYQQHIQIFHFMFYVDKSRGEFTAVCCALFLSASIISSEPSESPVPYKLVSGTWCTQLSLRIRCIQYLQILARFRYILMLASSMSCIYRCWLQRMKADAAWCPQCRDTCLLVLGLGTVMATQSCELNWMIATATKWP